MQFSMLWRHCHWYDFAKFLSDWLETRYLDVKLNNKLLFFWTFFGFRLSKRVIYRKRILMGGEGYGWLKSLLSNWLTRNSVFRCKIERQTHFVRGLFYFRHNKRVIHRKLFRLLYVLHTQTAKIQWVFALELRNLQTMFLRHVAFD